MPERFGAGTRDVQPAIGNDIAPVTSDLSRQ